MIPMTPFRIALMSVLAAAALGGCSRSNRSADDTLPDDLRPGSGSDGAGGGGGSEIDQRRDAACEALGPRMTACAIDDARRTMTAEELAELDVEQTAPIHTREFVKSCQTQTLSSRQVRVYEVCLREETACDAMIACLDNANPTSSENPVR